VDVISAAQTVAVVSVPGMGDGVQAIKAGLLEIADVHVVNKADRDGAGTTVAQLRDMLRLRHRRPGEWNVPIQQTVATTGDGVADLADRFAEHLAWMTDRGEDRTRARRNARTRIRWAAEALLLDRLREGDHDFDRAVDDVTDRRTDPLTVARDLVARLAAPST
jgi:LAO/AO transport system kinase